MIVNGDLRDNPIGRIPACPACAVSRAPLGCSQEGPVASTGISTDWAWSSLLEDRSADRDEKSKVRLPRRPRAILRF